MRKEPGVPPRCEVAEAAFRLLRLSDSSSGQAVIQPGDCDDAATRQLPGQKLRRIKRLTREQGRAKWFLLA